MRLQKLAVLTPILFLVGLAGCNREDKIEERGPAVTSEIKEGLPFKARPDFTEFEACGRPCYLPLYKKPEQDKAFLAKKYEGYPCEYYDEGKFQTGPGEYCASRSKAIASHRDQEPGDYVNVECQVRGQEIRNEKGESSSIWNRVENERIYPPVYAPDMWLGNTGWNDIPCDELDKRIRKNAKKMILEGGLRNIKPSELDKYPGMPEVMKDIIRSGELRKRTPNKRRSSIACGGLPNCNQ